MTLLNAPTLTVPVPGTTGRARYPTSSRPFLPATQFTTSGTTRAVGYDTVDGLLILAGQSTVFSSADQGTTLSSNKGVPLSGQTNPGNQIGQVVRFKSLWVCVTTDQDNNYAAIYTSPAPGSSGSCTWTLRQALTAGSSGRFFPIIAQDGTAVIVGEYGDPLTAAVKNPHIWRSTDGTTWTSVWSASGSNNRHVHAVAPDPYAAGTWYATFGDGPSPCMLKSTDYGVTWAGVDAVPSARQAVQISFTSDYIWLAPDASQAPLWLLDRATQTVIKAGAVNDHRRIAVPVPGLHGLGSWTLSSTTITDFVDVPFTADLIGCKITGSGIPDGATISAVTNTDREVVSWRSPSMPGVRTSCPRSTPPKAPGVWGRSTG
jgi:hypothetical protein